jgi:hypothetical protein
MAKNCIYCSTGIDSSSVVDMCYNCMYQVWGEKMTKTIIENMEKERDSGNLEIGKQNQSSNNEKSTIEPTQEKTTKQPQDSQKIEDLELDSIPF